MDPAGISSPAVLNAIFGALPRRAISLSCQQFVSVKLTSAKIKRRSSEK